MTESFTADCNRVFAGNAKVGEEDITSNNSEVFKLEVISGLSSGNSKNDIIVSADGVAKLTFGFLDDMQGGDSSLEPGEVKTPPPGSSPAIVRDPIPSYLAHQKLELPAKQLEKDSLARALKTVSQLEAEACEEKVRAILEFDAKRKREETERRKIEAEKRRQSGELDLELETRRKAKEERRKIKKLKKAKKEAEQALISLVENNDEQSERKKRKIKGYTESEESEGLCSSGVEEDEANNIAPGKHSSVLNSAIAIPSAPTLRYPMHLPPHLLPNAFIGGFRPINPFMRGHRPDFTQGRGGFIPRGRGGIRGRIPFQVFRSQFFPNSVNVGPLKFNVPHVSHGLHNIQQQRQLHTPPPNRGHSPILPPSSDLQWTKCKPSISFAFKYSKEHKLYGIHPDVKSHNQDRLHPEDSWYNIDVSSDLTKEEDNQKVQNDQISKKDKKNKSVNKEKKKSEKERGKDIKKSKKSKMSLYVSASVKLKKKSSKSSRRKIEKIRQSYGSSSKKTSTIRSQHSSEDGELNKHDQGVEKQKDEEDMPNEEEIRNTVENIKREKIENSLFKIEDLTLKVKPFIIVKSEPLDEEVKKKTENKEVGKDVLDKRVESCVESQATHIATISECRHNEIFCHENDAQEIRSVTPPLPPLKDPNGKKAVCLQNALEIQRRIDKLLQQDDIKLEAIEAAKELLIKKTKKHQNSKEKLTAEQQLKKSNEKKPIEDTQVIGHKGESAYVNENPKTYTDKELHKISKEADNEKEKYHVSMKHKEDNDLKHKDKSLSTSSKDKTKDIHKEKKKAESIDREKAKAQKSENDKAKEKSRQITNTTYRNPFKRSLSKDRFYGKIDIRRRTKTKSRERDFSSKRRHSNERRRGDSSGYSSGRISSKRRFSASSSVSIQFIRSKSGDMDAKGSSDSLNSSEKDRRSGNKGKSPESKYKRKRSVSPKRKSDKIKLTPTEEKRIEKVHGMLLKSNTPPSKFMKTDKSSQSKDKLKENKKSKFPVAKIAPKKRPLSFTQTEFLFPEEGKNDFILGDDEETNDSFRNMKSSSDKEDSPDTDDYMDNWENDEDVDLDGNSNLPIGVATPLTQSLDLAEEDSFVTRFANPSPPKELLCKHTDANTERICKRGNDIVLPHTPPLTMLKNAPIDEPESKQIQQEIKTQTKQTEKSKRTELFGMQELYDQFIKSVEASGVSIKTNNNYQSSELEQSIREKGYTPNPIGKNTQVQTEDPLSTSSNSTSSSTYSSSSSSSESNSSSNSSSSSSSDTSSEDSNDVAEFTKSTKNSTKNVKPEESVDAKISSTGDKLLGDSDVIIKAPHSQCNELEEREARTPPPLPSQKDLLMKKIPPTHAPQIKVSPKSDVAKDFKKLKNLEANLSRIQSMRANYDSNDEISEELHKMEMLFLQEKKKILQKYAKNTQTSKTPSEIKASVNTDEFLLALPASDFGKGKSQLPPEEPNKIFDANREAIKLTISPLKLSTKPAIFDTSVTEETEIKMPDDKEEIDFTEKLIKPAKEVAIVKPMMENKESRSKDSHRQRRSPVYSGSRERQRSPPHYRDRNRRSSSRNRFSPHRRGRGRSLSISPPRRGVGIRHGSPYRRGAPSGRFRSTNRRSRSRSRSPLRQFGHRRGKESSPFRRKRGLQQDLQTHYKKFGRQRVSRSRSPRSPQNRPRSPRTPPPRRRSYSHDPYSRSPLPFKPPSPPTRRSVSPLCSQSSPGRRARSPTSPRRPRSPRSPLSPQSPRSPTSPRSPLSPRSPDSSHTHRYDDHRYRRENSFERNSSISPHPQYYVSDSTSGVSSQSSSYYYNLSPNRISLDARINIVLNTPGGDGGTPPAGYEGYSNYAQYGGAAYMSIPPQPMSDPANNMGYYQNPYVPMMSSAHDSHHPIISHHSHGISPILHQPVLPPHLQPQSLTYSNIPTINSGMTVSSSPQSGNNFYYNDINIGQQLSNSVLKELPKAVAVQKGNVLEIVPSNTESAESPQTDNKEKISPVLVETIKNHIDKITTVSWKDEVNNRHIKSAVMRLNRGSDNAIRSILKRSEGEEKSDTIEKKKVYFEDGIYPSRDSEDEDRKLIECKIRKKVLRLRKKRGIEVPAARDLMELKVKQEKPKKINVEKLPPPPPPPSAMLSANLEQPIYLRPPTPIHFIYFHFDSAVPSMYVSQLEKAIPPRLLNPKCVPSGTAITATASGGSTNAAPNQSPTLNPTTVLPTAKKELSALTALNRMARNDNLTNSPKAISDAKQDSPNSQQSSVVTKPSGLHFTPIQASSQMSPSLGSAIRHPSSPIGFVGMRVSNFMRLPPSPLVRAAVPPHMHAPPPNMVNLPAVMVGMRHPQYNIPPPNLMPSDANYNSVTPYGVIPTPPPGFQSYGQRPINPAFFMGPAVSHTMHPPPPIAANSHAKGKSHMLHHPQHLQQQHPLSDPQSQHHPHMHPQAHQQRLHHRHTQAKPPPPHPQPAASSVVANNPQAMIAPYNIKNTLN